MATTVVNTVDMMDTRSRYSPFYTPPSCIIKTSAEIISEARAAMEHKTVRAVHTKRPFTPRDSHRILFGRQASGRPPSAISLGQVKFHDFETTLPKLNSGNVSSLFSGENVMKPLQRTRLPALPDVRRRKHFKSAASLDNLPEELDAELLVDTASTSAVRQTHSSPKERTCSDDVTPLNILPSTPLNIKVIIEAKHKSRDLNQTINEESGEEAEVKSHPKDKINMIEKFPLIVDSKKKANKHTGDFKKLAFSNPRGSTQDVLGMDKLMETNDNQINEARVSASKPAGPACCSENIPTSEKFTLDLLDNVFSQLQKLNKEGATDAEVISVFERLYELLEAGNIPGSRNNKLKSQILKNIYKFVESAGETLLLHISRIALMLRVSGHNLSAVCKLIFKISRTDKNDKLFQDTNVLELFMEALGRASPLEDAEACIYGYGALKFLTMNNQLLHTSLQFGALDLMVLHIKIVNSARLDMLAIPEQTSHAMFQLTGALRNIASEELTFTQLVDTGAINELCRAMELFSADLDLICNIARTLSIVSTNEGCCNSITNYESSLQVITKVLSKFPGRQDIVVRLGYALGNIMAKCHDARLKFYKEPGALGAILKLLESYLDKDLEMMSSGTEDSGLTNSPDLGSDSSVEDVIIKMIRIVANMCLHPDVGIQLTRSPNMDDDYDVCSYNFDQHSSKDTGRFVDILLTVLRRKSIAENEELVLSTLSTLNNLSFYADPEASGDSPFGYRQLEIAQALSALLLSGNEDCLIEVTRVFGNLTRSKDIRDYILETGGIYQLVRCLTNENQELLCTVTGVLVNLMADWDKRLAFKEDNGIIRLIDILGRHGEQDWQLASLVCQALWNFCIDSTHLYAALGIHPTNHLLAKLIDLLDEERLFGVEEGELDEVVASSIEYQQWEQFAGVATNLLEKIEQYLESLQAFKP